MRKVEIYWEARRYINEREVEIEWEPGRY